MYLWLVFCIILLFLYYLRYLSVTVAKASCKSTCREKGLFGAMDLEVSVGDWLALLLQACDEVAYCARKNVLRQIIHLTGGAEDRKRRVFSSL